MEISECPACQEGDHKRHVRNYDPAPKGVMGGSMCGCEGECVERGLCKSITDVTDQLAEAYYLLGAS